MKKIDVSLPGDREPWLIPTAERIRLFYTAKREGKRVCLMVYDHADTSTFRYRCYNVLQWTKQSRTWQAVYFYRSEIETVMKLLPEADLLELARLQWFLAVDTLICKARALHIPVLYEVDDCVFDLDLLPMLTNSIDVDFSVDGQYEYWFSYISRNGFTAGKADGFITTNDYLGRRLEQKFGKPYRVIRNTLNREQLDISERCRQKKQALIDQPSIKDDRFIIGYFSGSPSHNHDMVMIGEELAAFLDEHRDTKLTVVGFMTFPACMQACIERKQVEFTSLTDFMNLQPLTASVDLSIVPLLNNMFTNCKSELKFFEAGVVDTVTLASPTYTYTHCIRNGENGFLCKSGEWYRTLNDIYSRRDELAAIAKTAREDSLKYYSGEYVIREIEEAFNHFIQ